MGHEAGQWQTNAQQNRGSAHVHGLTKEIWIWPHIMGPPAPANERPMHEPHLCRQGILGKGPNISLWIDAVHPQPGVVRSAGAGASHSGQRLPQHPGHRKYWQLPCRWHPVIDARVRPAPHAPQACVLCAGRPAGLQERKVTAWLQPGVSQELRYGHEVSRHFVSVPLQTGPPSLQNQRPSLQPREAHCMHDTTDKGSRHACAGRGRAYAGAHVDNVLPKRGLLGDGVPESTSCRVMGTALVLSFERKLNSAGLIGGLPEDSRDLPSAGKVAHGMLPTEG